MKGDFFNSDKDLDTIWDLPNHTKITLNQSLGRRCASGLSSEWGIRPIRGPSGCEKRGMRADRPGSVRRFPGVAIIPLGDPLPGRSSHLPARLNEPPCRPSPKTGTARAYLMLLRVGFCLPGPSPDPR